MLIYKISFELIYNEGLNLNKDNADVVSSYIRYYRQNYS